MEARISSAHQVCENIDMEYVGHYLPKHKLQTCRIVYAAIESSPYVVSWRLRNS